MSRISHPIETGSYRGCAVVYEGGYDFVVETIHNNHNSLTYGISCKHLYDF